MRIQSNFFTRDGLCVSLVILLGESMHNTHVVQIHSANPADNFSPVFSCEGSTQAVDEAIERANHAQAKWAALSMQTRITYLEQVKKQFQLKELELAHAITSEMGKVLGESIVEAKGLAARIDLTINHALKKIEGYQLPDKSGEARYAPLGVLGVIGPFNFPSSLINSSVAPGLLSGNTVVVKQTEGCPLVGEIYAQCFKDAKLPEGVFNLVQGDGTIGAILAAHPNINGLVFTGSYATGRKLKEALLDQPHKLLALEMGGKNCCVVLDDADPKQALSEVLQSAVLTSGQRCTATSRVLVHKSLYDSFVLKLKNIVAKLAPGNPTDANTVYGPLASRNARERFNSIYAQLSETIPHEVLVESQNLDGGAFVQASLWAIENPSVETSRLQDVELFGPHLMVEKVHDLDHAISLVNASQYGLSNALFTKSRERFEHFYRTSRAGVINWNRSTNGAVGLLPFGGLGKSGNFRPAGIEAIRFTTYPVAINQLPFAHTMPPAALARYL